jgi:hypothetical protein
LSANWPTCVVCTVSHEQPCPRPFIECTFAEILEKKLKRERKTIKRLRHQLQLNEHAQSIQQPRIEAKDDEAPKLSRMHHGWYI